MRYAILLFFSLAAACSADFHAGSPAAAPAETPRVMQAQPIPNGFKISVTQHSTDEAVLHVEYPPSWWLGARVKWFRNGEPYVFPPAATDQTEAEVSESHRTVFAALPPDDLSDPFKEESTVETWTAEAVANHWRSDAAPVRTTVEVTLSRGCEVFHPGWVYVGCRRDAVFSVPLTEPVALDATSPSLYLAQVVEKHFLGRPGTPGHDRLRAFIHLVALSAAETTDVTLLPHDPESYLVNPEVALSPEKRLAFDRTCMDIPLVGSVCLNGFVTDVDNEPGGLVLDFGPEAQAAALAPSAIAGSGPILLGGSTAAAATYATAASYGSFDIRPLGDRRYEIALRLHGSTFDLLFEPPSDPGLVDVKNSVEPDYAPANDLSTYLKAYGHVLVGTPFEARFDVTIPQGAFSALHFTLVAVSLLHPELQFVFHRGPYCNSNLGTTETPSAGPAHSSDPARRPFDASGTPLYAGLISDTISGAQGGGYDDVRRTFYSQMTFSYPHEQSHEHGGSGAGRDRIGVATRPYAFDPDSGRFSDNPNNCVRPADACSVTHLALAEEDPAKLQDGGPEWLGLTNTAGCEWPNVSNNSDDAAYKISEQMSSIILYIQGDMSRALLNHARR